MYVIYDATQPHLALESAGTLDAIASALSSRSGAGLTVGVSLDGHSRGLTEAEQRELEERVRELRSLSGEI